MDLTEFSALKRPAKGAKKYCVYDECKTDSRKSDTPFISFPKACLKVRQQLIKPSKSHIRECNLCRKCDTWIKCCKRADGKFNNVLHVNKHTYICLLHFVSCHGPSEMYPNPLPATLALKYWTLTRVQKRRISSTSEIDKTVPKKVLKVVKSSTSSSCTLQENEIKNESNQHDQLEILHLSPEIKDLSVGIQCDEVDILGHFDKNAQTTPRGTQTTFVWHDVNLLKEENLMLKRENASLKSKLEESDAKKSRNTLSPFIESLKEDEQKCKFYTGLSFKMILTVFNFLAPTDDLLYWGTKEGSSPKKSRKRKLTPLEELVLTLLHLRLGSLVKDLSYRFNISTGLITKIVITWIQHMYMKLDKIRPSMFCSREKIQENLPAVFRGLKNIRVIIDCAEFFCQSPSNFEHQGNLYSHYKAHTTFKVLIGCTPNGGVSFVSELFEGSISDVDLVKQSKLLDLLDKDDLILADRGFNIKKLTDEKNIHLNIPPFLRGRRVLTASEEIETKKIAKQQIYVEHVVGRVKNFRLLQKTLPLNMRGVLSQAVFVCCVLTNFQPPILKPN